MERTSERRGRDPLAPPSMKIRPATFDDREELLDIWLRSVRATHTFLTEEDIQRMLPLVRDRALRHLELWVLIAGEETLAGFMGLDGHKLEMLFLGPEFLRQGGGTLLVQHARRLKGSLRVDVNEENSAARQFYQAMSFVVHGRSPLDATGKPHPLLHLGESPLSEPEG